ncbi:hypothetical protein NPIL_428801 [Nephila pilipes]|uniref:Uncharacterized protein n=1 Tax=Nephila pilipes TaxID=299642 RepID=A0A8X6TJR1_NEPPI|nr:hypothetical protein NPIL_428801 [Nephila pilipes]
MRASLIIFEFTIKPKDRFPSLINSDFLFRNLDWLLGEPVLPSLETRYCEMLRRYLLDFSSHLHSRFLVAVFGLLIGFVFICWIGFGSIFSGYRSPSLPLEITGCFALNTSTILSISANTSCPEHQIFPTVKMEMSSEKLE